MADQSSVNGHGTARVPGSSSAEFEGVAEFVDDLASLAELQAKLAAADFRDAARKSAVPIVLTVVGLTVLVASVWWPSWAGWLLASALKIHQGWAMILTAGVAMALGGLVAGGAGCGSHTASTASAARAATVAQPGMGPDRPCHRAARRTREIVYDHAARIGGVPKWLIELNRNLPGEPESHRQSCNKEFNDHGDQHADDSRRVESPLRSGKAALESVDGGRPPGGTRETSSSSSGGSSRRPARGVRRSRSSSPI